MFPNDSINKKEKPDWLDKIKLSLELEYDDLKKPELLRHVVLYNIYAYEIEISITEYDLYGDLTKYREGFQRGLNAAKEIYEMYYVEKKDIIKKINVVNLGILQYAINFFNKKMALYFAEFFNKGEDFTKSLKKDPVFRIGLLFKRVLLEDKKNLKIEVEECLHFISSIKRWKDYEGYVRLFQLLATDVKDKESIQLALEVSKINFKKNSRAKSAKIFGTPPDSYYDQWAIGILNLFKSKGIQVDVSGFEKLPKELIRGFN
jgi:hypothetical protein